MRPAANRARRTALGVLASMLWVGVAACGGEGTAPRAGITDSAGVTLVTSTAPDAVVEPARAWSLGGSGDDTELRVVSDLAATAGGMVLVANSGNAEILALDPTGIIAWRYGRRGAGPGEFQRPLSVTVIGDTAFAYEFSLGRLTVIGPDGTFARVQQLPLDGPNTELGGAFDDGSLLLVERHLTSMKPGLNVDSMVYRRVSTAGIPLGTIGWGRGSTVDFVVAELGPNLDEQAFGPVSAIAVAGDRYAIATGRDAEVRLGDPTGRVRRIVRWDQPSRPVTDADRAAYRAARLADATTDMARRMREEWLAHATFAATVPPTGLLALGRDGTLLVADYCAPGHDGCTWRMFDRDGRWRRTLRLPVRADDAVLADGLLVTLSTDAEGVERIDAWRL